MLIVLIWSVAVVTRGAAASGVMSEADHDFAYRGKAVPPALVHEFDPWLSDDRAPIKVTVNVSAAFDSNEYFGEVSRDKTGLVSAKTRDGGTYSYRRLGVLPGQVHVLRTFDSGGGSGEFQALLFVQFHLSKAYLADGLRKENQLFMTVLRRYPLGDRDTASVVVEKGKVVVGTSSYRSKAVTLKPDGASED